MDAKTESIEAKATEAKATDAKATDAKATDAKATEVQAAAQSKADKKVESKTTNQQPKYQRKRTLQEWCDLFEFKLQGAHRSRVVLSGCSIDSNTGPIVSIEDDGGSKVALCKILQTLFDSLSADEQKDPARAIRAKGDDASAEGQVQEGKVQSTSFIETTASDSEHKQVSPSEFKSETKTDSDCKEDVYGNRNNNHNGFLETLMRSDQSCNQPTEVESGRFLPAVWVNVLSLGAVCSSPLNLGWLNAHDVSMSTATAAEARRHGAFQVLQLLLAKGPLGWISRAFQLRVMPEYLDEKPYHVYDRLEQIKEHQRLKRDAEQAETLLSATGKVELRYVASRAYEGQEVQADGTMLFGSRCKWTCHVSVVVQGEIRHAVGATFRHKRWAKWHAIQELYKVVSV